MTSRNKREGRFAAERKTGMRCNPAQWAYRKNLKRAKKMQGRILLDVLRVMPDILPEEFLADTVICKVTFLDNGYFEITRINSHDI